MATVAGEELKLIIKVWLKVFTCLPAGAMSDRWRSWRSLASDGAAETLLMAKARESSARAHWTRVESIFFCVSGWQRMDEGGSIGQKIVEMVFSSGYAAPSVVLVPPPNPSFKRFVCGQVVRGVSFWRVTFEWWFQVTKFPTIRESCASFEKREFKILSFIEYRPISEIGFTL